MVQPLKQVQCCQGYHKDPSQVLYYIWSTSTVCDWCDYLRDQWFQCMLMTFFFASRFTIMKLMIIYRDIDAIHECMNTCHLTLIPSISNCINLWGGNLISHLLPLLGCNIKNILSRPHWTHIYCKILCLGWQKYNSPYLCHLRSSTPRVYVSIVGPLHNQWCTVTGIGTEICL